MTDLPPASQPPSPDVEIANRPTLAERPDLSPGLVLDGRYRLEHPIGSGGMGEVWSAVHMGIGMRVAVKVLQTYSLGVPEIVARFEREAVLLGRIRSEHVPRAIDFLVDPIFGPVLVTELVEGELLSEVLKRPISVEHAVALGIDLAEAVAELHRARVVHRDLKPGNVILRRGQDGRKRAVVLDLGVSRLVPEEEGEAGGTAEPPLREISSVDVVVGTLEYMAPEQIVHCGAASCAADVYSVGAVLFRALTGAHVFGPLLDRCELARLKLTTEAPPLPTGRKDALAHGLTAVVAKALSRGLEHRYASADELRADLQRLQTTKAPPVDPPASDVRPSRPTTRLLRAARTHAVTAAMVATVLLGVALFERLGHQEAAAAGKNTRDSAQVAPSQSGISAAR